MKEWTSWAQHRAPGSVRYFRLSILQLAERLSEAWQVSDLSAQDWGQVAGGAEVCPLDWSRSPCSFYHGGSFITQSCLTLCDLMDCIPPGSSVHGISQARRLEWVAISFSRGSFWPKDRIHVSCWVTWKVSTKPGTREEELLAENGGGRLTVFLPFTKGETELQCLGHLGGA